MKLHLFGCIIHLGYIAIMFIYTDLVYIQGLGKKKAEEGSEVASEGNDSYSIMLLACIAYPCIYEFV